MTQEPKPGRRIVSKGEYAKMLGKRVGISFSGFCLFVVSGVCVLTLLLSLLFLIVWGFYFRTGQAQMDGGLACLPTLLVFMPVSYYMIKFTRYTLIQATQVDPGVPLTRANTANLPAPDSLARASQEPAQAQEGVLLRAAAPVSERHEEQLLRAAGEQK